MTFNAGSLMKAIAGKNPEARKGARKKIALHGEAMVPHLIRSARSPDATLRWHSVDLLGAIKDPRGAATVLDRVLHDDDVHVRWRSIWALTRLKDGKVISSLLGALKSSVDRVRGNSAVALSLFGRAEAIPQLLRGLRNDDEFRRWESVNALGSVHNDASVKALLSILKTGTPQMRRQAALSLGRTGDKRALPALLSALSNDDDQRVRWRAALALRRVARPETQSLLKSILRREKAQDVKEQILETLGALDNRRKTRRVARPGRDRKAGR